MIDIKKSMLTTHVLDTSVGKPAKGIAVRVLQTTNSARKVIAEGVTDGDGRVPGLFDGEKILTPGTYSIEFDTGSYFASQQIKTFYPKVEIEFTITDNCHYHVPLLINPFGYSTYRGS